MVDQSWIVVQEMDNDSLPMVQRRYVGQHMARAGYIDLCRTGSKRSQVRKDFLLGMWVVSHLIKEFRGRKFALEPVEFGSFGEDVSLAASRNIIANKLFLLERKIRKERNHHPGKSIELLFRDEAGGHYGVQNAVLRKQIEKR